MTEMNYVVTSGSSHIDIDALASVQAYNEFLLGQGAQSQVVLTPSLNDTVPEMIRELLRDRNGSQSEEALEPDCRFVVMDVSNPAFFDPVVQHDRVLEVFDHHPGFEHYWQIRGHVSATIEPIGACATLVWERICAAGAETSLSLQTMEMLMGAILSNSLNFCSAISTARDVAAFARISARIGKGEEWKARFFSEVSHRISCDPVRALMRDQKHVPIGGRDLWFGQIELWDAKALLRPTLANAIGRLFDRVGPGLANIISIREGVNCIYTDSARTMDLIKGLLPGREVSEHLYQTRRLWLRKEILK